MSTVHLIEGPVGAGKSTYAAALATQSQSVHIALDNWFAQLFSPDRPSGDISVSWYLERKARLLELIWGHSQTLLASGTHAILELGLIQRAPRVDFCRRVKEAGCHLIVHVIDAPYEVRRSRVQHRNTHQGTTFAVVVPESVFEMASNLWEPPDEGECGEFEVRFASSV